MRIRISQAPSIAKFYLQESLIKGKKNYELMDPKRMISLFNEIKTALNESKKDRDIYLSIKITELLNQLN